MSFAIRRLIPMMIIVRTIPIFQAMERAVAQVGRRETDDGVAFARLLLVKVAV